MARRKHGQDIDGVVLLDKPVGASSNAALQRVRRAFDACKAGHTGSLDPFASGLLPICLGEATKLSGYLLAADKHYRVDAVWGYETETGDREGRATRAIDAPVPNAATLRAELVRFVGVQQQIPPMYSALKKQGKRLYEYAREGQTVEREPRDITVHALDLVCMSEDGFTLDVSVSSGTYIRTLIEDIARALGGCAHARALRRVRVGALGDGCPMIVLDDIERRAHRNESLADLLWPVSKIIADWPRVTLNAEHVRALCHGQPVACPYVSDGGGDLLRMTGEAGELYGLGYVNARGMLAPKRLFSRVQC